MEASTLRPAATLPKPRLAAGAPLLRLRSDEQLVALFRAGHDEAFRAIHDRYHRRLFAYARQMLPGRQDAEDVLQDVFVRAYAGLRASNRDLALRAWLFRVAHNRCIDQLRKPSTPVAEIAYLLHSPTHDPLVEVDLRESVRRLVEDIRRLPDQQRSALLMRELAGMTYAELACSLGISVGAVKSLLVRARIALAQASEARETACAVIREQLVEAHDRGIRPGANARRHMRDCSCCKSFRRELRGVSRQLAAISPALGPLGVAAKLLGFSGGGGAGGGAALLSGGGTTASAGGLAISTGHVATLIVAAVATAGGAVEIQRSILPASHHPAKAQAVVSKPVNPPPSALQSSSPVSLPAVASSALPLHSISAPSAMAKHRPSLRAPGKRASRVSARNLKRAAKPVTLYGNPIITSTSTPAGSSCVATSATTTAGSDGSTSTGTSSPTPSTTSSSSSSSTAQTSPGTAPTPSCSPSSGSEASTSPSSGSSSTATSSSAPTGGTATSPGSGGGSPSTSGTNTGTGTGTDTGTTSTGSNSTSG